MASFWEITIKKALGKLVLAYSLSELYEACITGKITVVPIQLSNLIQSYFTRNFQKQFGLAPTEYV